ncbi:MAG TPA: TolC family protein [Blastocatellia bacterium]|nr:TolC family protein [Blastocatellia bacterium]
MRLWTPLLLMILLSAVAVNGQTPKPLTLRQAQDIALQNHPRVAAAKFRSQAAAEQPTEYKSALLPTFSTFMTAAGAGDNTRIAAGGLNNPTILSRYSNGLSMTQLITDFGRTNNLVRSSKLKASAEEQNVESTREDILLQVDQAYFTALEAQAVEKVAEETVKERQVVLDQVQQLTNSKLKSSLDLSFAKVNLATAQLLLLTAQNDVKSAYAQLTAALGSTDDQDYALADEPLSPEPPPDLASLVGQAIRNRPDLLTLQFNRESAMAFAKAEHGLKMPSISVIGAIGYTPFHVSTLSNVYTAAGVNVSIPIFTGHLYTARAAEADFRAQAADKDFQALQNQVTRDVRIAWLNANNAYKQVDLTAQLVNQAAESLDLAKTRYDLGLSSIVELNQAQLNMTQAELEHARARYEYQIRYATLQHHIGALH